MADIRVYSDNGGVLVGRLRTTGTDLNRVISDSGLARIQLVSKLVELLEASRMIDGTCITCGRKA